MHATKSLVTDGEILRIDSQSIALSGIEAAKRQIGASSHNVANMLTEDFRPLRTQLSERADGGVQASVVRAEEPAPVDLAREIVDMEVASLQAKASARVLETGLGLLGSLLDLHA